ncbi:RBR-type E3 ubiquitin transferase [Melia azedarach]|uniref:RBR-type E3 ubiquitin transferase n=1 Tax=Melia azedarach TaxID=155640 RepID=A0ACC1Y4N0_MELAZ|nr:RBR-type E3 ubiquitin transferase [Melia azedarach]
MAMVQESVADLSVDDFYFSALLDEENEQQQEEEDTFTVSDVKYAEELQFQEALMASTISSQISKNCATPSSPLIIRTLVVVPEPEETEVKGESGESSLSFCEICAERKEYDQMFRIEGCVHSFCSDCISKHVATKIRDNITTVTCPGLNCKSILEFDDCKPVIPKQVLESWEKALCEEMIDVSQRFYCPFKDCSAMLVNDNEGGGVIRESECPFCHRLFCAVCYVPWHPGIGCEEFQRLNADERGREDLMVRELAKEQKWSRCPHCKFYVERTQGCPHMSCRCKFQFCYGCGSEWTPSHGGCQRQ